LDAVIHLLVALASGHLLASLALSLSLPPVYCTLASLLGLSMYGVLLAS